MNQQLLDYINQQIASNVAPDEIKRTLLAKGWAVQDVASAFISLGIHPVTTVSSEPFGTEQVQVMKPSQEILSAAPQYGSQSTVPQVESVNQFMYAGFWRRAFALFLDGLFLLAVNSTIYLLSFFSGVPLLKIPPFILGYFVLYILYNPILESTSWQGSIGKKLTGLSVTDEIGQPISFLRALARHVSKLLSMIFLIGFFMAGFTAKKQGLHDLIAKCLVVKNKAEAPTLVRVAVLVIELALISGFIFYSMFIYKKNIQTTPNAMQQLNATYGIGK
jgi:uncharacterized RDD family membrane protein YckC